MCARVILVSVIFAVVTVGPSGCEKGPPSSTEGKQKESAPPPVSVHGAAEQPTATQPTSSPSVLPLSKEQSEAARKAGVKPVIKIDLGGGVTMKMVLIRAGRFMMGSPASEKDRDDFETQHKVTITKPFYLGLTEVTQAQWQAVMGNNPSYYKGRDLPVETVSWEDCQRFLRKLNAKARGGGFRLPTEAEWEYACRAGTTTPFNTGATISTDQADYNGRHIYGSGRKGVDRGKTVPVGSFKSNAWDLCDMHGNVWEWCRDWKGDYPRGRATDPTGPATGTSRVLRGGSWVDDPRRCRSAFRVGLDPTIRYYYFGFRCVRTVVTP